MQKDQTVKDFYFHYHDRIADKRVNSPFWLRRYVHQQTHALFLPYLKPKQRVLDAGCGDGVLSCLMAQKGCDVTGVDISAPNIETARQRASILGVRVNFLQADAERLPFPNDNFDVVISSHVLEHLPQLEMGLAELRRLSRLRVLIAMPTCLNPACWALLGKDSYWVFSRRTPYAMPLGFIKTMLAWMRGEAGPDEGYGGNQDVPHIWRFPWVMRKQIEAAGFHIEHFEAGPILIPYLAQYLTFMQPVQERMDAFRGHPLLREFGFGSFVVCDKEKRW